MIKMQIKMIKSYQISTDYEIFPQLSCILLSALSFLA